MLVFPLPDDPVEVVINTKSVLFINWPTGWPEKQSEIDVSFIDDPENEILPVI